jgi:Spy/CpxP family protein refolding chaperone
MKTKKVLIGMLLGIMIFGFESYAQQRGPGHSGPAMRAQMAPAYGLSEEQQAKIKELRLANLEKMTQNRNQIAELEAKKRSLMTEKNPNQREIEKVIDGISALRGQQMKQMTDMQLKVRSMLTDEQRIIFDARNQNNPRRAMMAKRMQQNQRGMMHRGHQKK